MSKCFITDGVNGFLAATKEEWVEKMEKLIQDEALRHKLGEKAEIEFGKRFFISNVIADVILIYGEMILDFKKASSQ